MRQLKLTIVDKATEETGDLDRTVTLESLPVSATGDCYAVQLLHQATTTDDDTIATTSDGILTSVNSTREDTTLQIIQKLAETAVQIAKLAGGAKRGTKTTPVVPSTLQFTFDPDDQDQLADLRASLSKLQVEGLTFDISAPPTAIAACMPDPGTGPSGPPHSPSCRAVDGLVFRRVAPRNITMRNSAGVFLQTAANLPVKGDHLVLSLPSQQFVKTQYTIAFSDGAPTSLQAVRPSEAYAVVAFLPELLKTIISLPVEVRTTQTSNLTAESALLDARAALLASQQKLLDQQKAVQAKE